MVTKATVAALINKCAWWSSFVELQARQQQRIGSFPNVLFFNPGRRQHRYVCIVLLDIRAFNLLNHCHQRDLNNETLCLVVKGACGFIDCSMALGSDIVQNRWGIMLVPACNHTCSALEHRAPPRAGGCTGLE